MAHLQYMPGDPRLVDQLVYELKSKGIFDQFRKDCIADVDTRPAYQNLRQRVENSVSTFLARQCWQPDLNKNQLREKLRKHILDGNYLEQGVERIVDQVVNPKVSTVFVPKVEDLVYNYLGITRKKTVAEISNDSADLLPTDLEAVSPGSVKSNADNHESMEVDEPTEGMKMDVEEQNDNENVKDIVQETNEKIEEAETSGVTDLTVHDPDASVDKDNIPLPAEEIRPEDIPPPENSPPKIEKLEIDKIELPKEPDANDIPLPDEIPKQENGSFFKPINSDDESSSDSSLRRNMSPLTPIRNFNNENSCDAQQAFENQLSESKKEEIKEPNSFRFAIDSKSNENSLDETKNDIKEADLSYQLNQVNINNFNTPAYEDSSNSNNLQIDYESDANSKINTESKVDLDQNSEDAKKEKRSDDKKSSHKSSHRSRDSHKHSSSRDKKSDSKPSSSRDSSRHDKKPSKDESKHKSSDKERSRDRSDKKENKDSSRHRSSHKSSHKDSKSHRSSSSSHRHSAKSDDKKSSSSSQKDKDKNFEKSSSKEKSKDSKSNSHRSEKDRKSSSSSKSRSSEKDKEKKSKKDADDHYSLSGRGNPNRRSTDRDSNDGSSSSKGSHRPASSKSSESKKGSKESTSKSDNTSGSGSTSPSDKEVVHDAGNKAGLSQNKPIVRIETHLETPVSSPPRLPFVPDITLKKPKIASNFEEAKKIMKMRKFLEEEQRRMNQEAALLLEFQANVRPSLSQVYSSIPGPELEFACNTTSATQYIIQNSSNSEPQESYVEEKTYTNAELYEELNAGNEAVRSKNNDDKNIEPVHKTEGNQARNSQLIEASANKMLDRPKDPVETEQIKIDSDIAVTQSKNKETGTNVKTEKVLEGEKGRNKISQPQRYDKKEHDKNTVRKQTNKINEHENTTRANQKDKLKMHKENSNLYFFAEHEKNNAVLETSKWNVFLKSYLERSISNKLYLINCNTYEENVLRDVASGFGDYEIVNYRRNGHLKIPKNKTIVKNLNLSAEVSLPIDLEYDRSNDTDSLKSHVFSPDKSDCSFELSSDYDTKLEEMVNRTSRKEIMKIILGDIIDGSPTKMPIIDYITESNIDSAIDYNAKRKMSDVETTENNNRKVLTPNKIRKVSTSDLITSTTQDSEESSYNSRLSASRSKYLGRAKRVGLSRPKRAELPNSPSSDKSVENYEQNTPKTPNGKVKAQRHMVQRYETSDLYKPKLHYLSRRNVS